MLLPGLVGFPPTARICVPRTSIQDVVLDGFPCSAVLAVGEQDTNSAEPYVCIVDCRGILQGLTTFLFGEEGLPVELVYEILETFMPPHWRLRVDGADVAAGNFCCRDGQVLSAVYLPEIPSPCVTDSCDEDGESEHGTPDPSVDQSEDENHVGCSPDEDSGSVPVRSRTPRRSRDDMVDSITCHLQYPPQGQPSGKKAFATPSSRIGRVFISACLCQVQLPRSVAINSHDPRGQASPTPSKGRNSESAKGDATIGTLVVRAAFQLRAGHAGARVAVSDPTPVLRIPPL